MRDDARVNTHSNAFLTLDTIAYKGHAKSVPMCTTGKEVDTLSSGSNPMFCLQGPTRCLWEGTHLLMSRLTSRLPWLAKDSVARLIVQFLNRHAASMWYISYQLGNCWMFMQQDYFVLVLVRKVGQL